MTVRRFLESLSALLVTVFLLAACSEQSSLRRMVHKIGPEKLRSETIGVCREGFMAGGVQRISRERWPVSAHAFEPMDLWAEPDGAYLLMDTDADGERGVYFPRILSDKDPLCGPTLKHVKLADGIYWYERKRG